MATMKPPPEFAEEQSQWTEIESAMAKAHAAHEIQSAPNVSTSENDIALLRDLAAEADRLRASSREIRDDVSASIETERRALADEYHEVSRRAYALRSAEARLSALRKSNAETLSRRREAEGRIPSLRAAASERIDGADEVRLRRVRDLTNIRRELSLHALVTNIKWDYGRTDVLSGEVFIPGRVEHRRFAIHKEGLSEFHIADQLWRMIEG